MVTSSQPQTETMTGRRQATVLRCVVGVGGGISPANLNGVYHHTPRTTDYTGMYWIDWHGYKYSLKVTTMMIQKT